MAIAVENSEKFAAYAHPERLVSTEWLAQAIAEGATSGGSLVVVESDEDVLLYETGHIPGSVKIDWHTDLNDDVTRDYIDGAAFASSPKPREFPATPPLLSTAINPTGGPPTRCGSSPCSVTKTSGFWTVAGTSGLPKVAN